MDGIKYSLFNKSAGISNVTKQGNKLIFNYPCTSSIYCTPYEVILIPGIYRMSLWGAQGGSAHKSDTAVLIEDSGGKGAFVSGKIRISHDTKFYFYVGGKGEDLLSIEANIIAKGGFNGGGHGGYDVGETGGESSAGGGGSSDVRFINEDSIEGYKSRIIVAGAGGGRLAYNDFHYLRTDDKNQVFNATCFAGDAGALIGFAEGNISIPGTQTTGCFGKGENGVNIDHKSTINGGSIGGGGSGYYGGSHIDVKTIGYLSSLESGGAGGSSFVSGCKGCNAVARTPINEVLHTNRSVHYSRYVFSEIKMNTGKDKIKDPYDKDEIGHHGNGAIALTYISKFYPMSCNRSHQRINIYRSLLLITLTS